jgi:surfactin synthase thioesterase subunit
MAAGIGPGKWLLRRPGEDSAARLFCFPYAGVGASMYNRWPEVVGTAEVCRVQLPGRENRIREAHYGTYEELAERLAEALVPCLDRPFGFFGHCRGALVGFAVAAHLQRAGLPTPDRLFVSSQEPPHKGPYSRFLRLGNAELATELGRLTEAMGGRPHPDLIQLGLRVLRADISANRRYRLDSPVLLPTTVIHAIAWAADEELRPDQTAGWDAYAGPGGFHETVLEGGHYAFLGAPDALLRELAHGMSRASSSR